MTVDDLTALRTRREGVARAVATLTFDLGGLAAEMANAGQFRLDVLTRHAAELRAADAELTELDRQLAAAEQHGAGRCSRCATQNAPDAAFCSALRRGVGRGGVVRRGVGLVPGSGRSGGDARRMLVRVLCSGKRRPRG